ncbi:hypothetical protein H1P_340018 [Hyella patelloides LEGE 07179]|uniref:Uncharacterized protein n=1 Tax=Hyella patelloides LEGE 07179 TaxID=945734 RepID=A0A563VVN3_9CYAN|nr:hypothetical protein H1P_340018 [Hyella patelloides LEGE 07179]
MPQSYQRGMIIISFPNIGNTIFEQQSLHLEAHLTIVWAIFGYFLLLIYCLS